MILCEGAVYHRQQFDTGGDRTAAARAFRDLYDDWPEFVDNVAVMGGCTECGEAVFDGQRFHQIRDTNLYWHCVAHCCDCEEFNPKQGGPSSDT